MVNYLMLVVAIALSAIAAYYSIMGLAAIFAAAVIPIVIMGSALEVAKLVCASWVYRNWYNAPATIRYYLVTAVVVLMFITSMGTFGYLSKAHIDQTIIGGDSMVQLEVIDSQIESEKRRIDNAQRSLSALDRLVDQSDTESAIKLRNTQRRERTRLMAEIESASSTIQTLNVQAAPLRKELKQITAEVGPIKYIADLLYGESSQDTLERAVRAVIILIVIVFDPLAVVMLLAANHGLKRKEVIPPDDPIVEDVVKNTKKTKKKKEVVVQEEGEDWHPALYTKMKKKMPGWVQRVKQLKDKRDPSKIEIDKDKIIRM